MAFNIRPFGADFLSPRIKTDDLYRRGSTDEAFKALTMIGIFLSFYFPMQGPFGVFRDNVRAKTTTGYLTFLLEGFLLDFVIIPLLFLTACWISKRVSLNKTVKLKTIFSNFSQVLIPTGLAIWAAFILGQLDFHGHCF